MLNIGNLYFSALLSDATYALNENETRLSGQALINVLAARMTLLRAKQIESNFSAVNHFESLDVLGSGFDATVWRRSDGKLYVSMQGTSGLGDFLADVQLALTGNAGLQVIDMVNWWLRITTPVGQAARQIGLVNQSGVTVLAAIADAAGQGLISATDIALGVEVNGHSLGGYLATAFTRLLGNVANVSQTTTFNSAGFAPGSELAFAQLKQAIDSIGGATYGRNAFPAGGDPSQLNLFAKNGLNFTTNSTWFSQHGQRVELFNEGSTTQVPDHFMYKLSDSLALGNALSKLDPSLTTARLNAILERGSTAAAGELEGVLDGLRRLLSGNPDSLTLTGDAPDSALTRVWFHENLAMLEGTMSFAALSGLVRLDPSSDMRVKARNDFSALASLLMLSPVTLADTGNGSALTGVLQPAWGGTYSQWQIDRSMSMADRHAGGESFTDNWIADRSRLLDTVILQNLRNNTSGSAIDATMPGDRSYEFRYYGGVSGASGQQLLFSSRDLGVRPSQLILFDDDAGRMIGGTNNVLGDRLYGGGGADTVSGEAGADYLEGNAGSGGDGIDILLGGVGTDTYQFTATWGADLVRDADGLGLIDVEGFGVLTGAGAAKVAHNVWQLPDQSVNYTLVNVAQNQSDLFITFKARPDVIRIEGWTPEKSLGITLPGTITPPATNPALTADIVKKLDATGNSFVFNGVNYVADGELPGAQDILNGWTDAESIAGLGGNDGISGNDGADYLDGGEGDDLLLGDAGDDLIRFTLVARHETGPLISRDPRCLGRFTEIMRSVLDGQRG